MSHFSIRQFGYGLATALLLSTAAHAAAIATYSFTDSTLNPTSTDTGATATAITASPTVNNNATSVLGTSLGFYTSAPFMTAARSSLSESGTRSAVYFTFTVTPAAGKKLNLTSLTFNVDGGGGAANDRDYDVYSSVDSYATSLTGGIKKIPTVRATAPATSTFTPVSVDLSAAAFQGLSSITFQVRFFTPGVSQNVDFDDIIVNGTQATPEPAAGASLALGGLALLRRRRR